MDVSSPDHSDSDSGDSWTLVDHSPIYAEDAPVFPDTPILAKRLSTPNTEKDDDTDGISIISDSEHETSSPCELSYDCDNCPRENCLANQHTGRFISQNHNASVIDDTDLLGDGNGKHKTYVHRRNKRLSTVLNIIMLGSVITAAGVAIGHMWGAKNDCSLHTTPSVNKILSNLYKLQEENAYLRSKLKELTLVNNVHRRTDIEKVPKQQRCKKVYEGSLTTKNSNKATKCVDSHIEEILEPTLMQPEYEKDFLHDIDKLKQVYIQNKSWLDEEVNKRLKRETQIKPVKNIIKNTHLNTVEEEIVEPKDESTKGQTFSEDFKLANKPKDVFDKNENIVLDDVKVSYADSLKSDHQNKIINKDDIKKYAGKKEIKKNRKGDWSDTLPPISLSEPELIKDDRYTPYKTKQERKKHDRHKAHKKEKRKNKYEQWEMKGGYLKDYDEYSLTSIPDNENIIRKPDDVLSNDFVLRSSGISSNEGNLENSDLAVNFQNKREKSKKKGDKKVKEINWYDKRSALRSEARKKLEHELFGENVPNSSRWYFRRMQKREQCRAKGDNSTNRKQAKHMNYKVKH